MPTSIASEDVTAPVCDVAKPKRYRWKPSDGGAPRHPAKPPKRAGQAPGPETRLVGVPAAADMLGVSRGYFYRAILPALKTIHLGKRQLIEVAEVDAFIARQREGSTSAKAVA